MTRLIVRPRRLAPHRAPGAARAAPVGMLLAAASLLASAALASTAAPDTRDARDAAATPGPLEATAPHLGAHHAGPDAPPLLYVCNEGEATVAIVSMETHQVVRTIDLTDFGFSRNARPHHIAVEPDGSFWYVTLIGANRILKFDRDDNLVAQAEFETPGMLALHPDEDLLFVGRSMSALNPPQRIGVLRRSDMRIDEVGVFFPRPHALALGPSGHVYTASLGVNQMAAVDGLTEHVELIPVDGPPHALMQFAVSPDGRTLVGSGEISGQLLVFDLDDPARPRLTASIGVGPQPFDPIITRDGRWAYVGNKAGNSVSVIDLETRTLAATIQGPGLAQPHGAAVSPDGRWVYISNNNARGGHDMPGHDMPGHGGHGGHAPAHHASPDEAHPATASGNGNVVVIDARTHEIVQVIELGEYTTGIAVATPRWER